jgi:hypothetical protein
MSSNLSFDSINIVDSSVNPILSRSVRGLNEELC